jgi:hypothetical protein
MSNWLEPSHWLALTIVLSVALLGLTPLLRHRKHHRKHRKPNRPAGNPLPSLAAWQAEHDRRIREAYRAERACGAPRATPWEKATRSH